MELATWDPVSRSVNTPLASRGVHTYLKEADSRLAQLGLDEDDVDLSQLLPDKAKVDNEEAAKEELIKTHRLYVGKDGRQVKPKVGASGASAAESATTGVSSTAQSDKSDAPGNIKSSYRAKSLEAAQSKGEIASLRAFLKKQGFDPDEALKGFTSSSGQQDEDDSQPDHSASSSEDSGETDETSSSSSSSSSASGLSSLEDDQGGARSAKCTIL